LAGATGFLGPLSFITSFAEISVSCSLGLKDEDKVSKEFLKSFATMVIWGTG